MSKTRPVFAKDNELILVPAGNLVCIFSVKTGILQSTYAHKSSVLCIQVFEPDKVTASILYSYRWCQFVEADW